MKLWIKTFNELLVDWAWQQNFAKHISWQHVTLKTICEFYFAGSTLYYMNHEGALCIFDVKTGESREILDNTTFVSI